MNINSQNKIKIDVAIQSFKKPELLVYTLLSLHKYCKESIDTIWINDDKSGENILDYYASSAVQKALFPWKIKVRENQNRIGWWLAFVKGKKPKYLSRFYMYYRMLWNLYKTGHIYTNKEDIRYQWAIDNTNKEYLLVLHDDVSFYGDIVSIYLNKIKNLKKPIIVGDLGQCWRCAYHKDGCNPSKIINGEFPSKNWPFTKIDKHDHAWACRINEWCALISVDAAKEMDKKNHILYGNYDNNGDIGAYWLAVAIENGFNFSDPLPTPNERKKYYIHGYEGNAGHSVWVNQGSGKRDYPKNEIRKKLLIDFSFDWSKIQHEIKDFK